MFTGDMNPMHVDHEFAKKYGLYGGVFAPGLATVAIASGLNERLGLFVGTGLAMTSQTIRYLKVVLPGDTVKVRLEVKSLTPHKRRPAGSVEFGYQIVRGDGVVCVEGEWNILLSARNATSTKVRSNSDVPEAGSSEVGG
jgi:acyl dehydratase